MPSQTVEAVARGSSPNGPPARGRRRTPIVVGVVALGVLALIVALVSGGTSKTKVSGAASHRTTVAPGAAGSAGSQGPAGSTSDGSQLQAVKSASGLNGTPGMPLSVMVSNTQGLKDGDAVAVHVIPQKGSVVYGFEAFLCKAGVSYTLDPDIRPDDTGKCIAHPLSANSQDYIQVKASPPYSSAAAPTTSRSPTALRPRSRVGPATPASSCSSSSTPTHSGSRSSRFHTGDRARPTR